jgi:predicted O-methyltransferase YrrM
MAGLTRHLAPLLRVHDFSGYRTVVDVGGGQGALLEEILRRHPGLRGVLFDEPAVVERARVALARSDVRDRIDLVAGSFFDAVPPGDAYVLKFILHDWDDAQAGRILERCRAAGAPGATVVVIEAVIPPGNDAHPGKLADLEMLLTTRGGHERTELGFATLLGAAGFRLEVVVPTLLPLSVLVARAG